MSRQPVQLCEYCSMDFIIYCRVEESIAVRHQADRLDPFFSGIVPVRKSTPESRQIGNSRPHLHLIMVNTEALRPSCNVAPDTKEDQSVSCLWDPMLFAPDNVTGWVRVRIGFEQSAQS